jgi:hypothetical protein
MIRPLSVSKVGLNVGAQVECHRRSSASLDKGFSRLQSPPKMPRASAALDQRRFAGFLWDR